MYRSRTLSLLLSLLLVYSTQTTQALNLPEIGEISGRMMTPTQERRLGEAFMRQVRNSGKVIDEPILAEYLETLGSRLANHPNAHGHRFHLFLIDDPSINAFAGPAGHIGIHSGLILHTQTESELASVIAHEMAHITQHHLLRSFDAANDGSLAMAAAILAGVLVGAATKNSDATLAAITGAQAAAIQRQINFTRSHEKEADTIGIRILAESDYDPNGMPDFFERLERNSRHSDAHKIPEFLRTHPVTTSRIAESRARASDYPYRQISDSLEYHLLHAALKQRAFSDRRAAIDYFHSSLAAGRYRNPSGHRYGYARALLAARDYPQAREELAQLLREEAFHPAFIIAKAEALLHSGEGNAAVTLLRDARLLYSGSRPLLIAKAETLLYLERTQEAEQLLLRHLQQESSDHHLYRLAAQAVGSNGRIALGHLYLAESLYHRGHLREARNQLESGLRADDVDDFLSARLAARLRQISQELRQP